MLDLAIVGGGPGGLMSAWYLKKKLGDLCSVTIYEEHHPKVQGKVISLLLGGSGSAVSGAADVTSSTVRHGGANLQQEVVPHQTERPPRDSPF